MQSLWRIYRRPDRPVAWSNGGNLPWNDPDFSARMLREHLDESHGAATRVAQERAAQIEWMWQTLALEPGMKVCDLTCGPGLYSVELARRGCQVTGVDFSPAAIAYARDLAQEAGVADHCVFIEADVRQADLPAAAFDVVLFLYGQLAVFPQAEAAALLASTARLLKAGGRLCVELLEQREVDKTNSNWWFTGNSGLWGDTPFLHLGERFWDDEAQMTLERFYVVDLMTGALTDILLCDQTYSIEAMRAMMLDVGFHKVDVYPAWAGLPIYDAPEWNVFVSYTE